MGFWENFTRGQRGTLFIVVGAVLLLHALGIIKFHYDLFLAALGLYLIICGLMMTGYHTKLLCMLKNRKLRCDNSDSRP